MENFLPHHRRKHERPVSPFVEGSSDCNYSMSGSFGRGRSQYRDQYEVYLDEQHSGEGSSGIRLPSTASKLMSSMRRSLSYGGPSKKRESSLAQVGMHSTPEESLPPSPSSFSLYGSEDTRPSIEQIAMGLHVSRTPHLTPVRVNTRARRRVTEEYPQSPQSAPATSRSSFQIPHRRDSAPPLVLPPPPARSSMKKPGSVKSPTMSPSPLTSSASDVSLSSITSNAPSTPRSNRNASMAQFSARLHLSMSKLLPGRKNSFGPSLTGSDGDSTKSELTPRKMVRFQGGADVEES